MGQASTPTTKRSANRRTGLWLAALALFFFVGMIVKTGVIGR